MSQVQQPINEEKVEIIEIAALDVKNFIGNNFCSQTNIQMSPIQYEVIQEGNIN